MKIEKLDKIDIIRDTKKELRKEISDDIIIKLEKKCPKCDSIIKYKNKKCLFKSLRKNQLCRKCSRIGITFGPMSELHKEKIRNHHIENGVGMWMLGRKLSDEIRKKISEKNKGKIKSEEEKRKYSKAKIGDKNPAKRLDVRIKISTSQKNNPRIISDETRRKLSIKSKENILKRMEQLDVFLVPNYNPKANDYFDKLNEENGWNLKHATNGGEFRVLCYFIDAYDKERNIIIEYDESHHYDVYGQLKEKDVRRMNEIIEHLNCKFYRYNEKIKELKLYEKIKT